MSPGELACRTAPLPRGGSATITIDAVADGPGLFAPQASAGAGGDRATFRASTRADAGGFAWNMVERTHSVARGRLRFAPPNPSAPDIAPAELEVRFTCLGAPALPPGTAFAGRSRRRAAVRRLRARRVPVTPSFPARRLAAGAADHDRSHGRAAVLPDQ